MNRYFSQLGRPAVVLLFGLSVSACGGGGGDNPGGGNPPGTTADTRPEPVSFAVPVVENMAPGLSLESAPVFVKGIDEGVSIAASVEGGLIAVNSETDFVEGPVKVGLDDRILVRTTAPQQFSASHTATLTLGEGEGAESAEFTLATGESVFSAEPGLKSLTFKWHAMEGVSHFKLFENADGASGFSEIDLEIAGDAVEATLPDIPVHLIDWNNAQYQLHACNGRSSCVSVPQHQLTLEQSFSAASIERVLGRLREEFGSGITLSADGNVLAVHAAKAVADDGFDDSTQDTGVIYIFMKDEASRWEEQARLAAFNPDHGDRFGESMALNHDGTVLAVGAYSEDSIAVDDPANNSASGAGAVYMFHRDPATGIWMQQAYLKAPNVEAGDLFGFSVALNGAGDRLAVGARREDGGGTGVDPGFDNNAIDAGAVYVFEFDTVGGWQQTFYIKASNTGAGDSFGNVVALSGKSDPAGDGSTLVIAARDEDSPSTEIDGDQGDGVGANKDFGAVYVFKSIGNSWEQESYLKTTPNQRESGETMSLAMSRNGEVIAIGKDFDRTCGTGIDPQPGTGCLRSGAVFMFMRSDAGGWVQDAFIKASNSETDDKFGARLAISEDGGTLAVIALDESSLASGVGGDQTDNSSENPIGAAYIFQKHDSFGWQQRSYIKPSDTATAGYPFFGRGIAIDGDGRTLFIGAPNARAEPGVFGGFYIY